MLIRPAIGDTDPIRYRRPTPDGQFSGNIIDEAMRGSKLGAGTQIEALSQDRGDAGPCGRPLHGGVDAQKALSKKIMIPDRLSDHHDFSNRRTIFRPLEM
jgi:hypothetical protein